jgi:hypothetical protein
MWRRRCPGCLPKEVLVDEGRTLPTLGKGAVGRVFVALRQTRLLDALAGGKALE